MWRTWSETRRAVSCLGGVAISTGVTLSPDITEAGERDALWYLVKNICLPMQQSLGLAFPCLEVNQQRRYVVVRPPGEATHIAVVPIDKINGVEDAALLSDKAPNIWSSAWSERSHVMEAAPRPLAWDEIGMAVNSRVSRSQDQLHIHVDCLDPRLKRILALHWRRTLHKWSLLDLRPWAGRYRVRLVNEEELNGNVFRIVASEVPGAHANMGQQTIALASVSGDNGHRGFALLVNSKGGHAEELLDHNCSNAGAFNFQRKRNERGWLPIN